MSEILRFSSSTECCSQLLNRDRLSQCNCADGGSAAFEGFFVAFQQRFSHSVRGRQCPFFQPSSTNSCECSRAPGVPESSGVLLPGLGTRLHNSRSEVVDI